MSASVSISTHVLDTALGKPAAGVPAALDRCEADGRWTPIGSGATNADGRVPALVPEGGTAAAGHYRIRFDVADYFATTAGGRESFYDVVTIEFRAREPGHYHVPVLLSPWGYATYRGS